MPDAKLRAAVEQWLDDNIDLAYDYGYAPPIDALLHFVQSQRAEAVAEHIKSKEHVPQKSECGHYDCDDEDCYGK